MRPCGCKGENVCVCARGGMHDEDTRNNAKMHAPNECSKPHRQRHVPAASPLHETLQSACTGIHSPTPPPTHAICASLQVYGEWWGSEPPPPPQPRPLLGPGGREAGLQQGEGTRARRGGPGGAEARGPRHLLSVCAALGGLLPRTPAPPPLKAPC
jgi:hypothetical protein